MNKKGRIEQGKSLRRTLYVCSGALLLLNSGAGVVTTFIINKNQVQASEVSPQAGLADISILQKASLTSTTGNTMTPNAQGDFDLSLNYSGQGLATVGVADKKVLVFALPPELQGKVIGGATVDIKADLLPVTPGDLPGVKVLFDALGVAINNVDDVMKIPSVVAAYNQLKSAQSLGSYSKTLPATVSADGKTMSVDFTQGLGQYVRQAYGALFHALRDAINAINVTNPLAAPLVALLKTASNSLFEIIDAIVAGTSNILDTALNGNILGSTSGTLNMTVSNPGVATATVKAAAINNAVISADVLSLIEQQGESVTLNFPVIGTNPLENYDVAIPTVTQPVTGQTSVAGQVTLNTPVPLGTSFEAVVTLPDQTKKRAVVATDGTFIVDTGILTAGQVLDVKIVATNGEYTKEGGSFITTVTDSPVEDPLVDYNVATPTAEPLTAGDTVIKGQVTLNVPIPNGTTFEAVATLPDGSTKSGVVNIDGTYTITTDPLVEQSAVEIKIVAKNGQYTKTGQPITLMVKSGEVINPIEDYDVAMPTVGVLVEGDTSVSGQVDLHTPIPDGTNFQAVVTFVDNTIKTATVKADGSFTVPTGILVADEVLSIKIVATNGQFTKEGQSVLITVNPGEITNPLESYVVATPMIDEVIAGDSHIRGRVTLNTPIPEGTNFEAAVTLPGGQMVKTSVEADGSYDIDTGVELVAGSQLTIKITAINGEFTKDSDGATTMVKEAIPTNPLVNYDIASPTVSPATDGDTSLKGHVNLVTPIPNGTTFKALVIFSDGQTAEVKIDDNGNFEIPTRSLVSGEQLSVKVIAMNGIYQKESIEVPLTVGKEVSTNPLENYDVAMPSVNPVIAGNTSISGQVTLNKPIPEGTVFEASVKLTDGTTKTSAVTPDGKFTINTNPMIANDELEVIITAKNSTYTKDSLSTMVTVAEAPITNPLENYDVASPVLKAAHDGDVSVSGQVMLNKPIPAGTTFTATVTLPNGSHQMASIAADGTFKIPTGTLNAGDNLTVYVTAINGEHTKNGNPVKMMVEADEMVNPLADYAVTAPTVSPAIAGETQIKGNVNLALPIPNGTTFEVIATFSDGNTKTGSIDMNGNFNITTDPLITDEMVDIKVVATNGQFTKESAIVRIQASEALPINPLEKYTVATPIVDPVTAGDSRITGNVKLTQPIPEGTTFEATVILSDGSIKTAAVDENGHFEIMTGTLVEGSGLTVKITAKNNNYTKDSLPVSVVVAPAVTENPLVNYNVAMPNINPAKAGDQQVSGLVTLNEPIPAGTIFKAVITFADGTTKEGTIGADGNFVIATNELTAGEILQVKVVATNGQYTKDGLPVSITVDNVLPTNPLEDYEVAAPTVKPVINGDTMVKGQVNLMIPVPNNTTFTVIVTLPDGSTRAAPLGSDGQYEVNTPRWATGDELTVKVVASSGIYQKESQSIPLKVVAQEVINPLEDYEVTAPVLKQATEGDTSISGKVTLNTPIPEGTLFEANVILPDGSTKMATVSADGTFTINTGKLSADQVLSVRIIAKNGSYTKDGQVVELIVNKKEVTNPLENYAVNTPMVNPVKAGDAQVTGQVELMRPIPEGTDFVVKVTLPDGTIKEAPLDTEGKFVIETGTLNKGDKLTVVVIANNGNFSKDSNPVEVEVHPSEMTNPLENYVVNQPKVIPIKDGDTQVSGSVTLNRPIPEGTTFEVMATLPNGSTQTVQLNQDRAFTVKTDKLKAGEHVTVKVIAKNDSWTKDSQSVTITVDKSEINSGNNGNGTGQLGSGNNDSSNQGDIGTQNNSAAVGIKNINPNNVNTMRNSNKSYDDLPQTGVKSNVTFGVGAILLAIVAFLKKLVPVKRNK